MGLHDDVEFHVTTKGKEDVTVVSDWQDALSCLKGNPGTIDVVIFSEEGAKAFGGDVAVETYLEDPDASFFERHVRRKANGDFDCEGRVR